MLELNPHERPGVPPVPSPKLRVLLVDDLVGIRIVLGKYLRLRGYEVIEAASCREAETAFVAGRPHVAILDYQLPDGTALDLLRSLRAIDATVPMVVLTGHGTIPMAVQAMRAGAEQFLTKPIDLPALGAALAGMLDPRDETPGAPVARRADAVDPFLGDSPAIRALGAEAVRVLATESPILIHGETGTGKTVLARWLHERGPRAAGPFVDLNCATLVRELLETELFGHEKGAFTGAGAAKEGLVEAADKGTLFLDEIADMDVQVQPKILKAIEEKSFRRVGGVRDRRSDVRLVAATHQNLAELVAERRFRGDLYYRISAIPLFVPPLRERGRDVLALARHFLRRLALDMRRPPLELADAAEDALVGYAWPGNIRELRNVLERAALVADGGAIRAEHLRFGSTGALVAVAAAASGDGTIADNERRHIEQVLREENGRVEPAARRLGLVRSALYKKIKKHGIVIQR